MITDEEWAAHDRKWDAARVIVKKIGRCAGLEDEDRMVGFLQDMAALFGLTLETAPLTVHPATDELKQQLVAAHERDLDMGR